MIVRRLLPFLAGAHPTHAGGESKMSWLTAKHRVKLYCVTAALLGTCGVAMAAGSDAEQFARFKDPNQWGAPAGDLMQHRYSALKDINTDNVKDLQFAWAQSS